MQHLGPSTRPGGSAGDAGAGGAHRRRVSVEPVCLEGNLTGDPSEIPATDRHFVRSHFPAPVLDASSFRLRVEGAVERPLVLSSAELRTLESHTLVVTMECAGNGRTLLRPSVEGVPWGHGAVGLARWTGVRLADLLRDAAISTDSVEVVLEGADQGVEPGAPGEIPYAMSIDRRTALHEDTLVAYAMNGEPLARDHGFPFRAIVPGQYGMASVKWLARIAPVRAPFTGFFRTEAYAVVPADAPEGSRGRPVTRLRLKSLITQPADGAVVNGHGIVVAGAAWTGEGSVERVALQWRSESPDAPASPWVEAELHQPLGRYGWRPFKARLPPLEPGSYVLRARAWDDRGSGQTMEPGWNRRGLENDAVIPHRITVDR